jgi:hypothetical protein
VDRQDERKKSLESRGITVITTSGALATLLFGLATVGAKSAHIAVTGHTSSILKAALIAFAAAAVLAIATNIPLGYAEPGESTAADLLPYWGDDAARSSQEVAKAWGTVFADAKKMNGIKAWLLFGAVVAEVVAIGLVAAAVWRLL